MPLGIIYAAKKRDTSPEVGKAALSCVKGGKGHAVGFELTPDDVLGHPTEEVEGPTLAPATTASTHSIELMAGDQLVDQAEPLTPAPKHHVVEERSLGEPGVPSSAHSRLDGVAQIAQLRVTRGVDEVVYVSCSESHPMTPERRTVKSAAATWAGLWRESGSRTKRRRDTRREGPW